MRPSRALNIMKQWLYPANSYAKQPKKRQYVEDVVEDYSTIKGMEAKGAAIAKIKSSRNYNPKTDD